MAPTAICLICGFTEMEVKKMHYFPKNLEKSKVWQQNMGMKFSNETFRNQRICSRHFEDHCYIGVKLVLGAAPTLFPCVPSITHTGQMSLASSSGVGAADALEVFPQPDIASPGTAQMLSEPNLSIPGTSQMFVRATTPTIETATFVSTKRTGRSLFKGIEGLSKIESTPRKLYLMDMINKKEDQIRKLKRTCKERGRDMKSLQDLSDSDVVRNLFKGMSQLTADFLISQLRSAKKDPKGRRWTKEEKVVALAIFKRGPKCYNFLRKIVALPSRRTVLALLEEVPFSVGINTHLFRHINQSLTRDQDRLCVLLCDEMDIKEHLGYVKGEDRIVGFEDFGDDGLTTMRFANKALVFMCQGLARNWKQPIAYYFCHGACNATTLKNA